MMGDLDEAARRSDGRAIRGVPGDRWPEPASARARSPAVIAGLAEEDHRRPGADADRPAPRVDRRPVCSMPSQGLGDRLSQRLDAIQTTLEREAAPRRRRERVIDRLHAELQEYKQDLLLKVQRPIFIDLIQLHDDIGKMIEARPASTTRAEPLGRRPGGPRIDPGRHRGHPLPPGRRAVRRRGGRVRPPAPARGRHRGDRRPRGTRRSPPGSAKGSRPARS